MAQSEVLKVLSKKPGVKHKFQDICKYCKNSNKQTIGENLRKMRQYNDCKYERKMDNDYGRPVYFYWVTK